MWRRRSRNKFNNSICYSDGYSIYFNPDDGLIKFHSRQEAKRYVELIEMQERGLISQLKLQVPFTLIDPFTYQGKRYRKTEYICDFQYQENGNLVVEDVKGFQTSIFKLKMKLLLVRYPDILFKIT